MVDMPKLPGGRQMANDGYDLRGQARPPMITEGYKPKPQSGYVGPAQSAPTNPPSGGTSGNRPQAPAPRNKGSRPDSRMSFATCSGRRMRLQSTRPKLPA